jgi:hypothetical protein
VAGFFNIFVVGWFLNISFTDIEKNINECYEGEKQREIKYLFVSDI